MDTMTPSTTDATHKEPGAESPDAPRPRIPAGYWLFTRLFAIPLMALATASFGSVALLVSLWDKDGRQQHAIARVWAGVFVRIALSPVTVVGAERLRAATLGVYACNHLSYMDTPTLFAKIPFQFRILAKHDLWETPFVGWYLRRSGQVPIDQGSVRSAIAGLLRGVATLKAGMPIVVFPEGSRTPDGHPQAAASGAAFMAIRAGVPLIPLALVGTYELLPIHVYSLRPRPLLLIVGEPIATEGLTTRDAEALTKRLLEAISAMYYAHHPGL